MNNRSIRNIILIVIIFLSTITAQENKLPGKFYSERTTLSERDKFHKNLVENIIEKSLSETLNKHNEGKWQSAFWAMELSGYTSEKTYKAIKTALTKFDSSSISFNRALLEVVFAIYPKEFYLEVNDVFLKTGNPKIFAMAANYLNRIKAISIVDLIIKMEHRFPEWEKNPILFSLAKDLRPAEIAKPMLEQILSMPVRMNSTVIFCLQRVNRDDEGIIIIREASGKFLRDKDGKIFNVNALARSVTNMPYYLTNGNSPQGIYTVLKVSNSDNVFIGPTPTLEIGMPIEYSVNKFFHDSEITDEWSLDLYKTLLPEFVESDLYEAYYAGLAGRSEIIVHGTTINPAYYKNEKFYPNTPSLGCITLEEKWSENSGMRLKSNQAKLIKALENVDLAEAFFVLYEIDDKNEKIDLSEIEQAIIKAENILLK